MSDPTPPKPEAQRDLFDGIEPEDGRPAGVDDEADDIPVTVAIDEPGPWAMEPTDPADPTDPLSGAPPARDDAPSTFLPGSGGEGRTAQLIALASGRGGAGKSLLAANIAVYLAQMGKRVVAVDADPAGGSLNFMLGAARPPRGFSSFLRGRAESLDELAVDTAVAGVRLVAGEAQPFGALRPKVVSKTVIAALRALPADYVVVDLGPPDSVLGLDLWLTADTSLVVSLTDPASIESTYRFLKSAFLRRLRGERIGEKLLGHLPSPLPAALDIFRTAVLATRPPRDERPGSTAAATAAPPAPAQIALGSLIDPPDAPVARSAGKLTGLALAVAERMSAYRPRLVISQTRSTADTKLGPQMATAARRRLGHSLEYVGHVEMDETVGAAARRRRPVMAEFPDAKICKNIEKIVRRLLSTESDRSHPVTLPRIEDDQTFYELLETEPGVSDEEVRRAFRLFKEIYATSSPIVSGLYEDAELAALHARAEAAHDTLFAPERRRQYDLSLPEADLARAVRRAAAQGPRGQAGPAPHLAHAADGDDGGEREVPAHDAEITGGVLRRVREQRGLELSDIAQRTRISERHLRSIEEERFDELPAAVYVRGFVGQVARILKMDAGRTVESYLRRFHDANGPGPHTPSLKEL
jgi:flagellar biosynthesis protein FlhG